MRKIVSKFALAAGLVLAIALTFSCSSDGGDEGGGGSSPSVGDNPSSSSVAPSSSFNEPSSSSVSGQKLFAAEIGTICVAYANLFSEPLDDKYIIADGTDMYLNMQSICGDKSESYIIGTSIEVTNWLNLRNISTAIFDKINQELFTKNNSAFLGFYPAVDGYVRYLYIEELYDGKGLAKSVPEQQIGTAEAQ